MAALETPRERITWLWATAAALAVVFFCYPLCLGIPLVDPDEGLHASIAQEMAERRDWVTPRFLGEPFLDKPVLYTWAQALSLRTFGMHEAAVRLPGLLFGLLGMITTGVVAGRLFSAEVGWVAAILYATTALPTALAQCAAHDVALVPWVSLAILMFWEADRASSRRSQIVLTVAVGVLLGLSCLTKGFVGVALVGVAYGGYLLAGRKLTGAACLRGTLALAVAAVAACGWYVAMEVRNPGYLYYYFIERHLLGLVTDGQKHGQEPWWYYLPILLAGGLPWIIYLPAGVRDWWDRRGSRESTESGAIPLLLSWVLGCSVLLSVAGSKLVTYIWPVFPPLAILAALVWVRVLDGRLAGAARRWFSVNFWSTSLTGPLVVPMAMLVAQELLEIRFSWPAWAMGVAAGLTSWVPLFFWSRGRTRPALSAGALSIAAQFAAAMATIGPPAAQVNSAVDLAAHLSVEGRLPPKVVIIEDRVGSLVFYLDAESRAELKAGQVEPVRAFEVPDLPVPEAGTVIAMAEWRAPEAERYVDLACVDFRRAGRYRLYTPRQFEVLQSTAASRGKRPGRRGSPSYAARDGGSTVIGTASPRPL